MPGPAAPDGAERKLVTVLFVDVDEAVDDFAGRDPEDVGRMLAGHLARVRDEVEAFGGEPYAHHWFVKRLSPAAGSRE